MWRYVSFLIAILFFGCAETVIKEDLHLLNGYWQITKAEFSSGAIKEYTLGNTVDFIYLEEGKGYRKKVQPNLKGGFNTSDASQNFEIRGSQGTQLMYYIGSETSWTERLITLDANSFTVANEEGVYYSYERYEPLELSK